MGLLNLFRGTKNIHRKGSFSPGEQVRKELNWERIHGDSDLKNVSRKEIDELANDVDEISGGRSISKFKLDQLLKRRKIGLGLERKDRQGVREQLKEEYSGIEDEDLGGQKTDKFAGKDLENN